MADLFVSDFSGGIVTISNQREIMTEMVKYFTSLPENEGPLEWLAEERHLPVSILKEHDVFFIDEDVTRSSIPEKYWDETLGLCKWKYIIYVGRIVYPVKSPTGLVMGLCGWTKDEGEVKYLDSKNYGYKAKYNTMYGMEKLLEYYRSTDSVFLVEGIVDCLFLRSFGLKAFALLGSLLTPYIITILSRFGERLIVFPDNDNFKGEAEDKTAGEGFAKQVFYKLPKARVYQTISAKDLDDVVRISKEKRQSLVDDLLNIDNIFYDFKEIRQRVKPTWRKIGYGKV